VTFYFIFDVCFERENDGEGERKKSGRRRSGEGEPEKTKASSVFSSLVAKCTEPEVLFSFLHFFFHFGVGWLANPSFIFVLVLFFHFGVGCTSLLVELVVPHKSFFEENILMKIYLFS